MVNTVTSPIRPLLTPKGRTLLDTWMSTPSRESMSPLEQSQALRSLGASPELASAILTQCEIRQRAEGKFGGLAQRMLLTRDGYEQATRRIVAERHAQRFRDAGATHVADLGCGNGADSMALLYAGLAVHAVDIDEDAAACTHWNLQAVADSAKASRPHPTFEVQIADVTALDIPALAASGVNAIFADPARRTGSAKGGARIMSPEQWSPPLSTVLSWQEHVNYLGVKVAPGIGHEFLPADFCVEWVSVDGDLVEATLWSPALSPEGAGRQAVVILGEETHILSTDEARPANASVEFAPVGDMAAFIAEPDPAVIRAGLVSVLARQWGAHALSQGMAYLSGATIPASPFAQRFEVLDVVGLKPKAIAAALRGLNAHSVEVKKRGSDISPEALRQSIRRALVPKNAQSVEITVIATRIGGKHQAILARRMPAPGHAIA